MQFDAVAEKTPGTQWLKRWDRSWSTYRQWFLNRGGDKGPCRAECEAALQQHMPELVPTWKSLSALAGADDLSARFLSTWCPPAYLGGCSLAALSRHGTTRLVRNYDLSPALNEGLLLRTEWTGTPVMGMIEFLWGLSDGINQHGLAVALAFGGSRQVGSGFGVTTILRYIMETCRTVDEALKVLERVPSHMAYNIVLADAHGRTASVELTPGGGMTLMNKAIATNHQHGSIAAENAELTQTHERFEYLDKLSAKNIKPEPLAAQFLKPPLLQCQYSQSLGTLFTADYDTVSGSLDLRWPDAQWSQSLDNFIEGTRQIDFTLKSDVKTRNCATTIPTNTFPVHPGTHWLDTLEPLSPYTPDEPAFSQWMQRARSGDVDWAAFADVFTPSHQG